jgi:Molecular chaperone
MIADDKLEKERIDARNCLEEYVYDLRNKLGSEEEFALYIAADDASKLSTQLDETENWLYEEGADVNKSVYISKLDELKVGYCV